MPIHLLSTRQIAGAGDGQLADGEGLTLRIASDQGRWWFRKLPRQVDSSEVEFFAASSRSR